MLTWSVCKTEQLTWEERCAVFFTLVSRYSSVCLVSRSFTAGFQLLSSYNSCVCRVL